MSERRWLPLYAAWVVALTATLGTLFFSEVMKFAPCALCWYQRIGMYPLVAVLSVALWVKDEKVGRYAWPFVGFGLFVALYHNLVYYGVISESLTPCTGGVPCTERHIEWLGFVTIPLLSLLAFLFIAICVGWFGRMTRDGK